MTRVGLTFLLFIKIASVLQRAFAANSSDVNPDVISRRFSAVVTNVGQLRAQTSAKENRRAVMISMVSGLAKAYFELLELDDQLAISKRTRDSYERTFRLFNGQYTGGLASNLELSRAKLALRSVSVNILELERQIALKESEISTLLGRNLGPVPWTSTLLAQPREYFPDVAGNSPDAG